MTNIDIEEIRFECECGMIIAVYGMIYECKCGILYIFKKNLQKVKVIDITARSI